MYGNRTLYFSTTTYLLKIGGENIMGLDPKTMILCVEKNGIKITDSFK